MKNTVINLIEKKGSLELNMAFKQYWDRYGGNMISYRHSSYMMLFMGVQDDVVREFQQLHDEYWEIKIWRLDDECRIN
jgi:hypothetical protein